MDTSVPRIFFLLVLSVFRMQEACGKNSKIKIIVPHKISVIHHHHSRLADLKPKQTLHDFLKSNQIQHEEESEEEMSEEGRLGHYLGDADEEASQRGVAYYPIPTPEYFNSGRVYIEPVFLYNDPFDRKHPPRYEYHGYEDYNHPEESHRENRYRLRGFRYA